MVLIKTKANLQLIVLTGLVLLLFISSCSPTVTYQKTAKYNNSLRDSISVKLAAQKRPAQKMLIYLSNRPDSVNLLNSGVFYDLHRKARYSLLHINKAGYYNYFTQESLDYKQGRVDDLLGVLKTLKQEGVISDSTELQIIAEEMEGEAALNAANQYGVEKVIFINVSATTKLLNFQAMLKYHPKDSLFNQYLLENKIDSSKNLENLKTRVTENDLSSYSFGIRTNQYWKSYLDDLVYKSIQYSSAPIHWIYSRKHPLYKVFNPGLVKTMCTNKPTGKCHIHKVESTESKELRDLLLKIVRDEL